ncbi:MAG TPA: DUF1579 family protein [Fimbriimonadales bacterium]|nr:DUF1579 family protein [Fimbriimonadales bacterium]
MRKVTISTCCFLFVVSIATAQTETEKMMEMGKPGKYHKILDSLAGDWDVVVKYKMEGKEQEGKATLQSKWILDGRFLQQEYKSNFMGSPFTVIQILGYDNQNNEPFVFHINSMETGALHTKGKISEDGKVITTSGEFIDSTGKKSKLKMVFTIKSKDKFTLEWFQMQEGKPEERIVILEHTKKASP